MDRNSVFYFYGYAPEGSTATFNGKEATFYGRSFSVQLQLTEDVTPVEVLIQDASGDTLLPVRRSWFWTGTIRSTVLSRWRADVPPLQLAAAGH